MWYLRDENSAGGVDVAAPFAFGLSSWKPVTGDWSGSGITGIGMVDPQDNWYLRDTPSGGSADITPFVFRLGSWTPVSGTWTASSMQNLNSFTIAEPPAAPVGQPVTASVQALDQLGHPDTGFNGTAPLTDSLGDFAPQTLQFNQGQAQAMFTLKTLAAHNLKVSAMDANGNTVTAQVTLQTILPAITNASTGASLQDVTVTPVPTGAPPGLVFPDGALRFTVSGLNRGAGVEVTVQLPPGLLQPGVAYTYYKYNAAAANPWQPFPFTPATATSPAGGAVIDRADNQVDLYLVDGGAADSDGVANGAIVDPGVLASTPVTAAITGAPAAPPPLGMTVTLKSTVTDSAHPTRDLQHQ